MKQTDYAIKRNQIIEALRHLSTIPAGRRLVRYTHGWSSPARTEYFIGYQWARTHANPMTGMVYEATIARGKDFEGALAAAIRKTSAAAQRADELNSEPLATAPR